MVIVAIFGPLAVLSSLLLFWQWFVAMRFPLHQRPVPSGTEKTLDPTKPITSPQTSHGAAVTLLKPLKGADEFTETCLRSWFAQEYAGPVQILFGVATGTDPVCQIVNSLISEYPKAEAQLIICGPLEGANAKVSKLIQLEKLAKHDLLVISDADVRVPPDLLANVLEPFSTQHSTRNTHLSSKAPATGEHATHSGDGNLQPVTCNLQPHSVGLVNCFYSLANPSTLAMRWEAIAVNADFWSQVLQAQSLKPLDFALGAVMATTRSHLQRIGGFGAIKNCLADDYQLGHRIAKSGGHIVLSTVSVECFSAAMGWRAVWNHQLRWARTIRVSQPLPYFFSILSNATLWPLLWLALARTPVALSFAITAVILRMLMGVALQKRSDGRSCAWAYLWLIPVKDLLQTAIWAVAFMGNTIEWRGQKMKLLPNGELGILGEPLSARDRLEQG